MTQPVGQDGAIWNLPSVGRWGITALPQGWVLVSGFGIKQLVPDPRMIAANVSLVEDKLAAEQAFTAYIEAQMKLMSGHLKEIKLAGPQPGAFPNADDAQMLLVRHRVQDAVDILHMQNYVLAGNWVGIVTLTVPEVSVRSVRPDYDVFLKGLCILPEPPVETSAASPNPA